MNIHQRNFALDLVGGIFFTGAFVFALASGSWLFVIGCLLAAVAFCFSIAVGLQRGRGYPVASETVTLGRLIAIAAFVILLIASVVWMGWI